MTRANPGSTHESKQNKIEQIGFELSNLPFTLWFALKARAGERRREMNARRRRDRAVIVEDMTIVGEGGIWWSKFDQSNRIKSIFSRKSFFKNGWILSLSFEFLFLFFFLLDRERERGGEFRDSNVRQGARDLIFATDLLTLFYW